MKNIKKAIGYGLFKTGAYNLLFKNKAVVLLFHRVDDNLADKKLTCTSKMFADICEFCKQHFNVITLTELINKLNTEQDISGDLVITFDDGYLDNYEIAAPILKKLDLPACFFIATDFIGSNHTTWWDKQDGVTSIWMDWDQVRQLRSWGFEVAAHTKNHVDLGKVTGDEALEEIRGSKERLEKELSEQIDLFCYPYGRKEQITEENRQLVKDLGFICCPSAYGGLVTNNTDPFRMLRMPVDNYYQSSWEFGLEILRE